MEKYSNLTLSVTKKLKNILFVIPAIPQPLRINNREPQVKSLSNWISLECLLNTPQKRFFVKAMFTSPFSRYCYLNRLVLWPAERITGSEKIKISKKQKAKTKQNIARLLLELLKNWLPCKLKRFSMILFYFYLCWFCLTLSVLEKLKTTIFLIPIVPQNFNINN